MDSVAVHFTTVFMAFFAIMNPIANSSIFVSLTGGLSRSDRRLIALRSVLVAFIIIAVFTIGGREIFSVFGITLPAFRIAGGVMIAMIGYHLLQGEMSSVHTPSQEDSAASQNSVLDLAITPLGIPVLAGPGTIATAMNFSAEATFAQMIWILVAFAAMCVVTFLTFVGGERMAAVLGQNAIKVVSRLMGLILAVIGVQMLIDGIRGAIG